jgi:hypothetical protein
MVVMMMVVVVLVLLPLLPPTTTTVLSILDTVSVIMQLNIKFIPVQW